MDTGTKQRLVGAAVLIALAVIFLPMLVQGPAPDSGVSDVPLDMPKVPDDGEFVTRDLPLVTPGTAPEGGAVGLRGDAGADGRLPTVETGSASQPVGIGEGTAPDDATMQPVTTAAGDYAVHFGSYASAAAADTVLRQVRQARLPAYTEQAVLNGRPAWRVRIGPFATRADAESARLRAVQVRDDVGARVVVLDAATGAPAPTAASASASQPVAKPAATGITTEALPPDPPRPVAATQTTPAAATTALATPKPAAPKPAAQPPAPTTASTAPVRPAASGIGFAVQVGAFGNAAEATRLRDRLRAAGLSAFTEQVQTEKGALTRVRVGPVANRADADALKAQVRAKAGVDGIVRPHP